MTKLLDKPDALKLRRQFGLFDDFDTFVATQRWSTVVDAGASIAVDADGVGGILGITTNGDDNDEAYVKSTAELFRFAADKPLRFEARVQFSEAASDAGNLVLGLMNSAGADALVDNGAGPKANYSGALFFKVDGSTMWNCESSLGTTQETSTTTVVAGTALYQTLRIEFLPVGATTGDVCFFIDDVPVAYHHYSFAGAAAMSLVLGVKSGSAAAETLNVDYVSCQQLRPA